MYGVMTVVNANKTTAYIFEEYSDFTGVNDYTLASSVQQVARDEAHLVSLLAQSFAPGLSILED